MTATMRTRTSDTTEPGGILLVRTADGASTVVHSGTASLEHQVPIEPQTVMNVGSVAKQITAYLTICAAQAGLIGLQVPVAALLPQLKIEDVTVLDLIHHHGGIRDVESMLSLAGFRELDHYTSTDLLTLAYRQQRRAVAPGRFLYSNTGYLMLAEILRRIHGKNLHDIAAELVFDPLEMTSARFKADPREFIPAAATSYEPCRTGGWRNAARPVALDGPGSLWCSVHDLERWLRHLHTLWTRDDTLPLQHLVPYLGSDRQEYSYGPGLYADPHHNTHVFHYGHEHGFSSATHLSRDDRAIICMSNRADLPADQIVARIVRTSTYLDTHSIESLFEPSSATNTGSKVTGQEEDSGTRQLLGRFSCPEIPGTLQLEYLDGRLHLRRRGTAHLLTASGSGTNTYTGPGYTLTLDDSAWRDIQRFTLDMKRAPNLEYHRLE